MFFCGAILVLFSKIVLFFLKKMRKKIAQLKNVYLCGMEIESRRFLEITPKRKKTYKATRAIARLSHYECERLIACGAYNETYNGQAMTVLSFEQFGDLIGGIISTDKCINLKAFHKNKNFPDRKDFLELFSNAEKKRGGLFGWGKDLEGKPQVLFTADRRIVFAVNGELAVSSGFYNFATNYAGVWLQNKHRKKVEQIKFRLEMAHKTPVHKKLPTVVDIKTTIYANEKTTTTESRENWSE